jgi:hypothetical protein
VNALVSPATAVLSEWHRQSSDGFQVSAFEAFETQLWVAADRRAWHAEQASILEDVLGSDGSLVDVCVDTIKVGGPRFLRGPAHGDDQTDIALEHASIGVACARRA